MYTYKSYCIGSGSEVRSVNCCEVLPRYEIRRCDSLTVYNYTAHCDRADGTSRSPHIDGGDFCHEVGSFRIVDHRLYKQPVYLRRMTSKTSRASEGSPCGFTACLETGAGRSHLPRTYWEPNKTTLNFCQLH